MKLTRIPKQVVAALEETGLPYEFTMGGSHIKMRLAGQFVGIIPKGKTAKSEAHGQKRALANSTAQIRRMARQIKEGRVA